ncbi:MAG TPA: alpha/beta hydrolase [Nocardioidaceae bacterium]|nr:alpha/beta hydrolase [Nocardioidaceae bacterium]
MTSTSAPQPAAPGSPSEEQIARLSTGMDICYQTFGSPDGDPLLLVMGLGGPMTWWSPEFCSLLAGAGFYVIRYDNRDTGRSTHVSGRINRRMIVQSFLGLRARTPYSMQDMADDGFALLDHLGIDAAHVVGISMGGMIVQTMALSHPDRVLSLTSIMSTTGKRTVGWQDPRLLPMLLARRAASREAYIESSARMWQHIGSPHYPDTVEAVRDRAAETWDRGVSAAGVARQMGAILTQPNRSRSLRGLRIPTLVIHGMSDKMVHVSGGRATSHSVPGSELLLIPGMGHDVPVALHETFVDAIRRVADKGKATRRPQRRQS